MSDLHPSGSSRPRPSSKPRQPPPSPSLKPSSIPSHHSPPLSVTIRFSTHIPDLHLDIPHPPTTTIASLRHLIRARLPPSAATHRLRFIHAGKILTAPTVLSTVALAAPPPPPTDAPDRKGKGKDTQGAAVARIYLNCSIGDILTAEQLAAEEEEARKPVVLDTSHRISATSSSSPSPGPENDGPATQTSSLLHRRAQRPQGFDRLLASGFTPSEVHSLRLQFRGITAARHTADTMPSPDGMRRLEDAWMDSNHMGGGAAPVAVAGGGEEGEGGDGVGAMIDVLVQGMLIGFVWPLGSGFWLVKEEGLMGYNWRLFVTFGVMFSVLIGMVKSISG